MNNGGGKTTASHLDYDRVPSVQQVLVTGGAGYVGSIVVERLLATGNRVRVVDALMHGHVPSLLAVWGHPEFEFIRGDVTDAETRRRAVAGVDAVVHLAAIVGDPACTRRPELAWRVNYEATKELLTEAVAADVQRFVFASTCSNYGKMADPNVLATEAFELRPVSLYAETKVAAELEVLNGTRNGLATTCLRFATVYGTSPRMRFDLTVNEFARDVVLERELVVFGEQFWRPYVHVGDAATAVALAIDAPPDAVGGEVFNVGTTEQNFRKLDLVEMLKERIPDANVAFVPRNEDPRDYRVSFEKVKQTLGFEPRRSVPDGIDEVFALVRSGMLADPDAPEYKN
jgi:nucleoside-diphosphate-sugar epimerase